MLTHQGWFNLLYMQPLHAPQANEYVICIPIYIRAPHRHISIDIIIPLLNNFFNRISDHADYPEPWSYSIIVSILKKGNANDPNNYRGISLLDVLGTRMMFIKHFAPNRCLCIKVANSIDHWVEDCRDVTKAGGRGDMYKEWKLL